MKKERDESEYIVRVWLSCKREATQSTYSYVIEEFKRLIKKPWREVRPVDVWEYVEACKGRKGHRDSSTGSTVISDTTLKRKLGIMHVLFEQLRKSGNISINPTEAVLSALPRSGNCKKRAADMVPVGIVRQFVTFPGSEAANASARRQFHGPGVVKKAVRDRAVLAIMFGAGLRIGEVVKIRMCDIQVADGGDLVLSIRDQKNRTDSLQHLSPFVLEYLLPYLDQRRAEGGEPSSPLFVRYERRAGYVLDIPYAIPNIRRLFNWVRDSLGLPRSLTPHSCRRTAITQMLLRDVPMKEVQLFARHGSIQVTEVYDKRYSVTTRLPTDKLTYD
jgi:integrase